MNPKAKFSFLLYILATFGLVITVSNPIYAQDFRYVKNIETDSLDHVTGMACDDFNNSYVSFIIEKETGPKGHTGKVIIAQFDSNGAAGWKLSFTGKSMISDLIMHDTSLYATGHTNSAVEAGGLQIDSGKMFVMRIGKGGAVKWITEVDSLNGLNAKLALANNRLYVSGLITFPASRIIQLDLSGNEVAKDNIDGAYIADIVVDEGGNLYVTGTLLGLKAKWDTLNVVAPFGYGNYLLKFNNQMDALWVRFTHYITLDFHQRVEVVSDRVAVLHKVRFASSDIQPVVLFYNSDGSLHDSMKIKKSYMPFFEMAVADEELVLMYDTRALPDTIQYIHFDKDMNITERHQVIGDVPQFFNSELFPFEIAANKCNVFSIVNYQSDSIRINSTHTLQKHYSNSNNAIIRYNRGCSMFNTSSTTDIQLNEMTSVYPNPFTSNATFEIISNVNPSNVKLYVFNIYGQEMEVSYSISDGLISLLRGDMPSGLYIYKILEGEEILSEGKIIAQ